MKKILLAIVFALAISPAIVAFGAAPNDNAFCRVTPRAVGFPGGVVTSRVMDPYVGDEPLLRVFGEACITSFARCAAENRTPFPFGEGLQVQWQHADMRFVAALDPGFTEIIFDETLTHPTIGFGFPSYDGVTDFAGPSGTMHENMRQQLVLWSVPVKDPAFFEQPWTVYLGMFSPDGVTSFHQGTMTSQIDQVGAMGLAAHYGTTVLP